MDALAFFPKDYNSAVLCRECSTVSTLLKATSDNGDPIPGYLFDQILAMPLESPLIATHLVEFLVDRLKKDSHHVKLKTLKVMKHLVDNGSTDFCHDLRRKSQVIQAASNFSGPPDEYHGNTLYAMVRQLAKELTEVLFDIEAEHKAVTNNSSSPARQRTTVSSGIGNIPGLSGFGNSPTRKEKTVGDTILSSLGRLTHSLSESPTHKPHQSSTTHSHYKPVVPQPLTASILGTSSSSSSPKKHIPGKAGGGWDDDDDDTGIHGNTGSSGSDGLVSLKSECSLRESEGSEEQGVVSECMSKPGAAYLTRNEISTFINRCWVCNCDKVVELLNTELTRDLTSQTHTTRALQLVEQLMYTDMLSIELLVDSFKHNLIRVLSFCSGTSLFKAKKILWTMVTLTNHTLPLPDGLAPLIDTNNCDVSNSQSCISVKYDTPAVCHANSFHSNYVTSDSNVVNADGEGSDTALVNGASDKESVEGDIDSSTRKSVADYDVSSQYVPFFHEISDDIVYEENI